MAVSTESLRKAWKEYRCAEGRMTRISFGPDSILVAPPTVDAWKALESVLLAYDYDIRPGDTDSYNCRTIKDGSGPSLHSYGIALDINWQTNPWRDHSGTRPPRFSNKATQDERGEDVRLGVADTDMTREMVDRALAIRTTQGKQVFEWGGDWSKVKDAMHFEIDLTPQDLAAGIDWSTVMRPALGGTPPPWQTTGPIVFPHGPFFDDDGDQKPFSEKFARVKEAIEVAEGGFSMNVHDKGGATNFGITIDTLSRWRKRRVSVQEVRALSLDEAREILYSLYWKPIRGDDMPAPAALMTYNASVNSGPSRGAKLLQEALRDIGFGLAVDGVIGDITADAARRANQDHLVSAFADRHRRFYEGLDDFRHFGRGWMNRLTTVTARARTLAVEDAAQSTSQTSTAPGGGTVTQPAPHVSDPLSQPTLLDRIFGGRLFTGKKTAIGSIGFIALTLVGAYLGIDLTPPAGTGTPPAGGGVAPAGTGLGGLIEPLKQIALAVGGVGVVSKIERWMRVIAQVANVARPPVS